MIILFVILQFLDSFGVLFASVILQTDHIFFFPLGFLLVCCFYFCFIFFCFKKTLKTKTTHPHIYLCANMCINIYRHPNVRSFLSDSESDKKFKCRHKKNINGVSNHTMCFNNWQCFDNTLTSDVKTNVHNHNYAFLTNNIIMPTSKQKTTPKK